MTHDTEHELSAIWDIPHGEGLAILFPTWITYVCKNNPSRFTRFAEQVFGITEGTDEERVMKAVSALKNWYHSLGLRTSLKEVGITDESKFELMAENCVGSGSRGHMASLSKEDIVNIFHIAL